MKDSKKLFPYLTNEAKAMLSYLKNERGLDEDVAFVLLESLFEEHEIYDLGEDDNER